MEDTLSTEVVETPEVETPEAPEAKTMDDTIRETLSAIEARGESLEEPAETEAQKADRQRDEKGRFAPKQEAQKTPEVTQEPQEAAPVNVPPELQKLGLRKEEAEAISANPVALQAFMRRSEEMHKGLEQYRSKAQFGDTMERTFAPYQATLQSIGVSPDVAVQKLLGVDHALRYGDANQKLNTLMSIAQSYGVDGSNIQNLAAQPQIDPQVSSLQSQLNQMQNWIQQQNQQREWQERQTLNSEIDKFKTNPANKHFDSVRDTMAGLLQAGLASSLQDAYEQAIYANPNVRAQILAEQQAAADEKRKAEATQKAQEAKRSAAVNIPKRGILPPQKPVGTMDDTIREAAARLGIM